MRNLWAAVFDLEKEEPVGFILSGGSLRPGDALNLSPKGDEADISYYRVELVVHRREGIDFKEFTRVISTGEEVELGYGHTIYVRTWDEERDGFTIPPAAPFGLD